MAKIARFLAIITFATNASLCLAATVVTLQEGVNGYAGCEDTYIDYTNIIATHGSDTSITVTEGNC